MVTASYDETARSNRNGQSASTHTGGQPGERRRPSGIDHGWMGFADFMAQDVRQDYLVDGIVPEAQGGIISGRFKTLKTSIALDLFISMASGAPFLDEFRVRSPVPCALMTSEAGAASIIGTCARICAAKGIDYRDGPNLTTLRAKMTDPRHLDVMERNIERHGWRCVGIDPTYLAFAALGESVSNVFKMGEALEPITDLIQRTGCSVLLINHNTKGRMNGVGRFDPPDLAEISMSGWAEWMRFWLLLAQADEWDEATGTHRLWLRSGGSVGHAALHQIQVVEGEHNSEGLRTKWQVDAFDHREIADDKEKRKANAKAKQREQTEAEHVHKLRDALNTCRDFESARKLGELSGLSARNFGPAITTLMKRGEVEQQDIVKRGNACPGYRLNRDARQGATT
ncbi:MAG TPA: AAA family ATPase [Pirellulales bacterium]|nr:AAA family ATPase [Pirellulales bacterium]